MEYFISEIKKHFEGDLEDLRKIRQDHNDAWWGKHGRYLRREYPQSWETLCKETESQMKKKEEMIKKYLLDLFLDCVVEWLTDPDTVEAKCSNNSLNEA